jgi:hypothetical protein
MHNINVHFVRKGYEAQLVQQKKALTDLCNKSQEITEDTSNGYVQKIADLNNRIGRLNSLREKADCRVSVSGNTSATDAAGGAGHGGQNGADLNQLISYAYDARELQIRVEQFQHFVCQERALAKQHSKLCPKK